MYDKFTNSKKEQFEQLLRDGVPPTLIMFEFGISKEQMKILMYNVQNNNNHYYYPKYNMESYASINGIDNEYDAKAKAAHKKMEEMRKKYRKLYFDSENNNTLPKATKKQSEKKHKVIDNINDNATLPKATQNQSEQIDNVISIIEADIKKVENGSRKEKTFIVKEIENNVNGILGYNFSMTQICQLTHLLQSEKLNYARYSRAIGESIYKIREKTIEKLEKKATEEINQANDLESLEKIKSQIPQGALYSYLKNGKLLYLLSTKDSKLREESLKENEKNNVSNHLRALIKDIANGNVNIEKANQIIEEDIDRRTSQTKIGFAKIPVEKQRKQVGHDIRNILERESNEFKIKNPEESFKILQQLFPNDKQPNLRSVVKSLSSNKKIDEAKSLCNKELEQQNSESEYAKYIRDLRKELDRDEIASLVRRGLEASATPTEEEKFLKVLEQGLNRTCIKTSSIIIAESQSRKKITLADILPEYLIK